MNIGEDRIRVQWDQMWLMRLLYWTQKNYPYFGYFHSNSIPYPEKGFSHLLLAGNESIELENTEDHAGNWLAGIISYEQKNQYENLQSQNSSLVSCPDLFFFRAVFRVEFTDLEAIIHHPDAAALVEQINSFPIPAHSDLGALPTIRPLTSKETYFENFHKIQEHIREGDIYEMNYCMAYEGILPNIDPIQLYFKLNACSPMPFSGLFAVNENYVVSTSPERFLKKQGNKLLAQPIKGSTRRGNTELEDDELAAKLRHSEKEQAENLMIVDLTRNDLSRVAQIGSVGVDELFGIYRFKKISQMISTVSCLLKDNLTFSRIIEKTFPMGSMTGAPKIKSMELIDQYEDFRRGWFSGSMGYIEDTGDFDWNVIIRSVILEATYGKFYFAVGSAITIDADPDSEFEECLLKSQAIFEAFLNR
ncbi:MAG: anthranilate synthase component I family protein [Lunatimonas sp.]|uniref:anthranilate synthase component I family protein n=1 Tax=Lunatimonas sp. TaxID=2060141 RepID=UPI00263BCC8D|nr:anthranilate synthase component I family protein [Lunatimonas sp.]MCC5935657.1 anthranilate synthase component I family protein [Lunatimonas sp.]